MGYASWAVTFFVFYIEDIFNYSDNVVEHTAYAHAIVTKRPQVGVYYIPEKSQFRLTKTDVLGYVV